MALTTGRTPKTLPVALTAPVSKTPVHTTSVKEFVADAAPTSFNVAVPTNAREVTLMNLTETDWTVTIAGTGDLTLPAHGTVDSDNPNMLTIVLDVMAGTINFVPETYSSSVGPNINGGVPRVISNFKSYSQGKVMILDGEFVVPASGGGGQWEFVDEGAITSGVSSVLFTTLPQGYERLLFSLQLTSDGGTNLRDLRVKATNGVATEYGYAGYNINSTATLNPVQTTNDASGWYLTRAVPGLTSYKKSYVWFTVMRYADSSSLTFFEGRTLVSNLSETGIYMAHIFGWTEAAVAVDQVELLPNANNFGAGSTYKILGLKGVAA